MTGNKISNYFNFYVMMIRLFSLNLWDFSDKEVDLNAISIES